MTKFQIVKNPLEKKFLEKQLNFAYRAMKKRGDKNRV